MEKGLRGTWAEIEYSRSISEWEKAIITSAPYRHHYAVVRLGNGARFGELNGGIICHTRNSSIQIKR